MMMLVMVLMIAVVGIAQYVVQLLVFVRDDERRKMWALRAAVRRSDRVSVT